MDYQMDGRKMKTCDLMNILAIIDESLDKTEQHLRKGFPDRALIRVQETRKKIRKLQTHFDDGTYLKPRHHPPSKAIV